jgi:hypothetical protein
MQNKIKWLALFVVGLIGLYLVVCLVLYRIPATAEPEYFSGRVIYMLDDATGTNRQFFEELMGNHIVRLEDDSVWYVSERDYNILWPRDPYEMRKLGQTLRTELKVQKLRFGGYIVEEIRELDILNEAPTIIE